MDKNFHTKARQYLLVLLGLVLILFALGWYGFQTLSERINQNKEKITNEITSELGFPITFDEVRLHRSKLSLAVSLKKVVIFDRDVPVPFISIDAIEIFPDLIPLLFKNKLIYKKTVLAGLKMVVGLDKKQKFTIKGLKGESIPATIEYSKLLELLAKQEKLFVKEALLDWRGVDVTVKQGFEGEFVWIHTKETEWSLTGKQSLQINKGAWLPKTSFKLEVGPDAESANVQWDMDSLKGLCRANKSEVHCNGKINDLLIEDIHEYYQPRKNDHDLIKWLFQSLKTGTVSKGSFKLQGSWDDLDWQGDFTCKEMNFQYHPGWPSIEHAKALIEIEEKKVRVQVLKGEMMEIPLETSLAVIEPIGKNQSPIVHVEGSVVGSLEQGLSFLQNSPLRDSVAKSLASLNPHGPMHLDLKLDIPTAPKAPVKVDGLIAIREGQVNVEDWDFALKGVNGNLHFTEKGIDSPGMAAEWEGDFYDFTIETVGNNEREIQIQTKEVFSTDVLRQFRVPFLDHFSGESEFSVTFKLPLYEGAIASRVRLEIGSDLEGIEINLPVPLGKKKNEIKQTSVSFDVGQQGNYKVSLNSALFDGKFIVAKKNAAFQMKWGHVVFGGGKSDWISKEGLLITGTISHLEVGQWMDFFEESNQALLPPLTVHLFLEDLDLYGFNLKKTLFKANFAKTPLEWGLEGALVKGTITLPSANNKLLRLNLDYLKMLPNEYDTQSKIEFFTEQQDTSILFRCGDLEYNGRRLGAVQFALLPKPYGFDIQNFSVKNPSFALSANGEWRISQASASTHLRGSVASANMGEMFARWGFPSVIKESRGTINFQFNWPSPPFQFNLASIEGVAQLQWKQGRILGVEPGLGRVIGLLDLENIRRRLQLDFSDLYKEGFIFDTLKGQLQFINGMVNTKQIFIEGPAAKITLAGKGNLKNKAIDLNMTVRPEAGGLVDPIIVAGGIANPVAGLAIWAANKLTGSPLSKITGRVMEDSYHVTGTWDAPSIRQSVPKSRK